MKFPPDQAKIRREHVTASTSAGFLGYDPYINPMACWERHLEKVEEEESPDIKGGNRFESAIIDAAVEQLGAGLGGETLAYQAPCPTYEDPLHPWLAATPDCLLPAWKSGIQAKNQRPHMVSQYTGRPGALGKWDNELIPRQYLFQVQVEMIVVSAFMGWDVVFWHLAPHFGGPTPRLYRIRREEKLQAGLLHATEIFWLKHIDPNGPMLPPTDAVWLGQPEKQRRKSRKLPADELLAAPLPEFSSAPASELAKDPYGREEP